METDLVAIKTALAAMTDSELNALSETTYKVSQATPGLLAWIDSACIWQFRQRNGHDEELQPPEGTIPPEEEAVSVEAAIALRVRFADQPAVRALFDALVEVLTGGDERKKH